MAGENENGEIFENTIGPDLPQW